MMCRVFKGAAAGAVMVGLVCVNAAQAEGVTVDERGYAQCDGGNDRASEGRMSTDFGNQFWSHMGCGQWDEAFDILDDAPKAHPGERLPTEDDYRNGDPRAACYIRSFAYWFNYHVVQPREGYDEPMVPHGFYLLKKSKFSEIQRAVLEACKPAIS